MESLDPDVQREYRTTMKKGVDDDNTMLKVVKMSKTFRKGRTSSGQDCRALDYITLCGVKGCV